MLQRRLKECPHISCVVQDHLCRRHSGRQFHHREITGSHPGRNNDNKSWAISRLNWIEICAPCQSIQKHQDWQRITLKRHYERSALYQFNKSASRDLHYQPWVWYLYKVGDAYPAKTTLPKMKQVDTKHAIYFWGIQGPAS